MPKNVRNVFGQCGYTALCARKKKQLMCLKCVSKLSEPAKDKTLKGAEIEKFLCKLFNVAEYIFTQYIVTLFFFLSFLKYYPALFVLPA